MGRGSWNCARRANLQTVVEQSQVDLAAMERIVAMGHGVDDGFENRRDVVSGVAAKRPFVSRPAHVADNEAAGFNDLARERPRQIFGIDLCLRASGT